ncbi:MAG: hypothetical protein WC374_03605 [Phycisphaerae bacterium]|jgi:hypothetical protein
MADLNDDLNLDAGKREKDLSPIPFDDKGDNETEISHAPLNLGGSGPAPVPAAKPTPGPAPAAKPIPRPMPTQAPVKPAVGQQQAVITPGGKITGVKLFFTKLHAGAMDFLSEQVTDWLKANPNITIKQTNMTVGEVAAKKTEPNLIIAVWY